MDTIHSEKAELLWWLLIFNSFPDFTYIYRLPLQKLFKSRQIDHCFPPWTSCSSWKRWQWEDPETLGKLCCKSCWNKRRRLTCTKLVAARKIWGNIYKVGGSSEVWWAHGSGLGSRCFAWRLQDTLGTGAGYLRSTSAPSFWTSKCQLGKSLHIGPVFNGHAEFALCGNEIHTSIVTSFNMCVDCEWWDLHFHTTPIPLQLRIPWSMGMGWVQPTWEGDPTIGSMENP